MSDWPPEIPQMPALFGDLFTALVERIDEVTPVDGTGIRVADSSSSFGKSINLFGAAGGGSSAGELQPWQPIPGVIPNTVKIEPFGKLIGMDLQDYLVGNRNDDFEIHSGDVIYLEMEYNSAGSLSTVTLKGGEIGVPGQWENYPIPIEKDGDGTLLDPYVVTFTRFLLAYTALSTDALSPRGCMTITDGEDTLKIIRAVYCPPMLQFVTTGEVTFEFPLPFGRLP